MWAVSIKTIDFIVSCEFLLINILTKGTMSFVENELITQKEVNQLKKIKLD